MDKLVFQASFAFGFTATRCTAERLSILGLKFSGTGEYTVLMTVLLRADGARGCSPYAAAGSAGS